MTVLLENTTLSQPSETLKRAIWSTDGVERVRQPIDIEALIAWALRRSGRLPWLRAGDRELAFDRGFDAMPRRRPNIGWVLAEACAGLHFAGRGNWAMMSPGPDAAQVVAAIRRLPADVAAMVIACGRAGIRPDWMEGVEPRQVPKSRRDRRRHRRGRVMVWEPCHPDAICQARDAYRRWWHGIVQVSASVGPLAQWEISTILAPPEPWLLMPQKNACIAQNASQDRADHDRAGGGIIPK